VKNEEQIADKLQRSQQLFNKICRKRKSHIVLTDVAASDENNVARVDLLQKSPSFYCFLLICRATDLGVKVISPVYTDWTKISILHSKQISKTCAKNL